MGGLRQGANAGVMVEAVAAASGIDAALVRRAAMLAGAIQDVATAALLEGVEGLAQFSLTLFRPVLPMLASPSDDIDAALDRLGEAMFECKLDGARVQVHKDGDEVRVFTRKLHDVTSRVPEIVETVRAFGARSCILDGEAIALRPDGTPHTFQTTMRRFGRRLEVDQMRHKIPLSHLYFDALYLDGDRCSSARHKSDSARSTRSSAKSIASSGSSPTMRPRRSASSTTSSVAVTRG